MASTHFDDYLGPPVLAAWLNDVNNAVYNIIPTLGGGSSSQVYLVAPSASGTYEAVPRNQADSLYAAISGNAQQVFSVALSASGTYDAVPRTQADSLYAPIAGNAQQTFLAAASTPGTYEAVPRNQADSLYSVLTGPNTFNALNVFTNSVQVSGQILVNTTSDFSDTYGPHALYIMSPDGYNAMALGNDTGKSRFAFYVNYNSHNEFQLGTITNSIFGFFTNNGSPQLSLDPNGGTSLGSYGNTVPPANGLIVSGNVGIGQNSAPEALNVTGNGVFTGTVSASGGTTGNEVVNISQFLPATVATNGSQPLPPGTILMWGTATVAGSSSLAITFATPFPNACFVAFANTSSTANGTGANAYGLSASGMSLYNGSSASQAMNWFALGN